MSEKKDKTIFIVTLCAFLLHNADLSIDSSKYNSFINNNTKSALFIKNKHYNKIKIEFTSACTHIYKINPAVSRIINRTLIYNHPLVLCNKYPRWSKCTFKYFI
jgi:hypothetical protein